MHANGDAAVDMASYFLPVGDTVVTEDFKGKQANDVHRSVGYNIFQGNPNFKMAILVDQGSASASEILAGALQQHNVAKLVGTRTFGKGSVQELLDLGGGAGTDPETIAKGSLPTTNANPTAIIAGRQLTTTGAVALASNALVNGVVIKALSTNVATLYLGPSGVTTGNGYPLDPGEAISYGATNLNAIYLIGVNTTDAIAYTGN